MPHCWRSRNRTLFYSILLSGGAVQASAGSRRASYQRPATSLKIDNHDPICSNSLLHDGVCSCLGLCNMYQVVVSSTSFPSFFTSSTRVDDIDRSNSMLQARTSRIPSRIPPHISILPPSIMARQEALHRSFLRDVTPYLIYILVVAAIGPLHFGFHLVYP